MLSPEVLLGLLILIFSSGLWIGTLFSSGFLSFLFLFGVPLSGALAGVWLRMRSEERKQQQVTRLRVLLSGVIGVFCAAFLGVFLTLVLLELSTRTAANLPSVVLLLIVSGMVSAPGITLVIYGLKARNPNC